MLVPPPALVVVTAKFVSAVLEAEDLLADAERDADVVVSVALNPLLMALLPPLVVLRDEGTLELNNNSLNSFKKKNKATDFKTYFIEPRRDDKPPI